MNVGEWLCFLVAGLLFVVVCVCAFFARIVLSQKGAVGCFVLAGAFCCLFAGLLLLVAVI